MRFRLVWPHGRCFAFQKAGITPDVIVLSKAIGGGLPLSVVVYSAALDLWQPGAHAGTFRGNQMAMATGSATIRFIQEEQLHLQAAKMGERLMTQLFQMQGDFAVIGDVRGRGLMIGVEIVDPDGAPDSLGHPPGAPSIALLIQYECLRRGLILETGGRKSAVLRLLPPLIVTEQEIDKIARLLREALAAVISQRSIDAMRFAISQRHLSPEDGMTVSPAKISVIQETGVLPTLVEPRETGLPIMQALHEIKDLVPRVLHSVGGVLFRGFGITSPEEFHEFASGFDYPLLPYDFGSTPRSAVMEGIYTSTEYPASQHIPLHNEQSYTREWAMKLWFYCMTPSTQGGQTPIVDSRRILQRLKSFHARPFCEQRTHVCPQLRKWARCAMAESV